MENMVNLCVDSYTMERQQGRFYHSYACEPTKFRSLIEAFEKMNDLYNGLDFPQASTKLRSFPVDRRKKRPDRRETGGAGWLEVERKRRKEEIPLKQVIEHRGERATFLIRVKYRQNSSWQGEVIWVDGQKKEYFRSALELIMLLDNVLEKSGGGQTEKGADRKWEET